MKIYASRGNIVVSHVQFLDSYYRPISGHWPIFGQHRFVAQRCVCEGVGKPFLLSLPFYHMVNQLSDCTEMVHCAEIERLFYYKVI